MQGSKPPPYETGDLLVISTTDGFLVARARKPIGVGKWWEFVAKTRTLSVAVKLAQDFAIALNRRAWIEEPNGAYREITISDS